VFYRAESYGFSPEFMELVKDLPVNLGGTPIGLLALTRLLQLCS
jgi:hypothetical protein